MRTSLFLALVAALLVTVLSFPLDVLAQTVPPGGTIPPELPETGASAWELALYQWQSWLGLAVVGAITLLFTGLAIRRRLEH